MLKNIMKFIDKHYDIVITLILISFMLIFHLSIKSYLNSPATEENQLYAAKYCENIDDYYPSLQNHILTKGEVRLASLKCKTDKENKKVSL